MIIEITGSTSSGKSFFSNDLFLKLQKKGYSVIFISDKSENEMKPSFVYNYCEQSYKTDIFVSIFFLLAAFKEFKFIGLSLYLIFILSEGPRDFILKFRVMVRKIGVSYFLKIRHRSDEVIIVDEGKSHLFHNLAVGTSDRPFCPVSLRLFDYLRGVDFLIMANIGSSSAHEIFKKRRDRSPRIKGDLSATKFIRNAIFAYQKAVEKLISNPNEFGFKFYILNPNIGNRDGDMQLVIKEVGSRIA